MNLQRRNKWQTKRSNDAMRSIVTRFRAYQLGCAGGSYSYFADGHFTLIEARLTDMNQANIIEEMTECCVGEANTLHITSWDMDHCAASELERLLEIVEPRRIEAPGYDPHTDNGVESLKIIRSYRNARKLTRRPVNLLHTTPEYIDSLGTAARLGFNDVFYHPKYIDDNNANNNSTVKMFRGGSFNVLSLGDIECSQISARLRRCSYLRRETDVMILAHHGANNGFTNKKLLNHLTPSLTLCASHFDNQYDHPKPEIRSLLHECNIRLMTTKTGDVIVESVGTHQGQVLATNWKANTTEVSSTFTFQSKKANLLSYNQDTIRQIYKGKPAYRFL
jgi:competence protein ComEC